MFFLFENIDSARSAEAERYVTLVMITGIPDMDHVLVPLMLLSGLRDAPPAHAAHSQQVTGALRGTLAVLTPRAVRRAPRDHHLRDTPAGVAPLRVSLPPCTVLSIRSMPRESLDAPEDLPTEAPRQVAFGQLQDVVPGMSA